MRRKTTQQVIVVLGMHRSGTSAVARGLKALGVELGNNLISPMPDNEKGFWEDVEISELSEDVLATLGCTWHSLRLIEPDEQIGPKTAPLRLRAIELISKKFGESDVFGFKNPRICRLLPFWQQVFEHLKLEDKYVISIRNPLSVAKSLGARNGFSAEKSHLLWLEHVIPSLSWTQGKPRVVIDYDRLLSNPVPQMKRVASSLGIVIDDAAIKELSLYAEDFLEENLRHTQFEPNALDLDPHVPKLAADAYYWLLKYAADEASLLSPMNHEMWHHIEQSFTAFAPVYDLLDRESRELATELEKAKQVVVALTSELKESQSKLTAVLQSNSWRITLPLREARRWVDAPTAQAKHYAQATLRGLKRTYQALRHAAGRRS